MRKIFNLSLVVIPSLVYPSTIVLQDDVDVKKLPSLNSKVVKKYKKGRKLKVSDNHGAWYKVEDGFIFLKPKNEIKKDKKRALSTSYIKYFEDLDIYERADNSSNKIDTLKAKTLLDVECEVNSYSNKYPWYKTKKGYVSSPYLYNPKSLKRCEKPKVVIPTANKGDDLKENSNPIKVNSIKDKKIKLNVDKNITESKDIIAKAKNSKKENMIPTDKNMGNENLFFIGSIIGVNALTINTENKSGTVNINTPLDESGYSINFHVGAKFDENYRVILNYDYLSFDDVTLENYYLSANYQWNRFLNPYIGASSGVSFLNWETDPLTNSTTKDTESAASWFIGLQTGFEYKYNESYSFISQLLYQEYFHKTKITNGTNEIEIKHDRVFQLGVGLRYGF